MLNTDNRGSEKSTKKGGNQITIAVDKMTYLNSIDEHEKFLALFFLSS